MTSPDAEFIRERLLDLLAKVQEVPADEYPSGPPFDNIVIWQLGEFREPRAVEDLRRIGPFDPMSRSAGGLIDRGSTVVEANRALEKIESGS